ncbi:MAG TPA: hypothetical protein PLJ35_08455 [Anaerolineae bacterium]|nr:hypothetical protein [Anaerolineae bacterium]
MPQTRINRRRFLLIAGGVLGASALACGGLGALADQQPTPRSISSHQAMGRPTP